MPLYFAPRVGPFTYIHRVGGKKRTPLTREQRAAQIAHTRHQLATARTAERAANAALRATWATKTPTQKVAYALTLAALTLAVLLVLATLLTP